MYYDNIGYVDLLDFFFCWMRVFFKLFFLELFGVLVMLKVEELVVIVFRYGGREFVEVFFLDGMG